MVLQTQSKEQPNTAAGRDDGAKRLVPTSSSSGDAQPELAPCISDESAWCENGGVGQSLLLDNKENILRKVGVDLSSGDTKNNSNQEVMDYLLRYEAMVLQQDAEEMATLAYIRPLLERVQVLGDRKNNQQKSNHQLTTDPASSHNQDSDICQREITFGELKRALAILERQDRDSNSSNNNSSGDDLSDTTEIMTKDRQLMMILRMLTQKLGGDTNADSSDEDDERSITWAEVIHCYRVCIIGLLTLKDLPKPSIVRSRAKERILSQLSLFEIPAKQLQKSNANSADNWRSNDHMLDRSCRSISMTSTNGRDHVMSSKRASSKKLSSDKRNEIQILAVVVAFCLAATFGFLFGMNYNSKGSPSHSVMMDIPTDSPSTPLMNHDVQHELSATNYSQIIVQEIHDYDTDIANDTGIGNAANTLSTSRNIPVKRRRDGIPTLPSLSTAASSKPQKLHKFILKHAANPSLLKNETSVASQMAATAVVSTSTAATTATTSNSPIESQQSGTNNSPHVRLPHEQLLVSAGVGGAVGVLVTPQIISFGQYVANALSLGSLGIVPQSLIVVGAVAVASAAVKGVRFILDKYLHKKI